VSDKYAPVTLGAAASFGFGDRMGLATPGHVESMQRAGTGILPIYAQQSIREMARTRRSPEQVMADARTGMKIGRWKGKCGADADHLKTPEDVDRMVAAGFTFFTIDPSDHVDPHADDYDEDTLKKKFEACADDAPWFDEYKETLVSTPTDTMIDLDIEACMRCAVKYGKAIKEAIKLGEHIEQANLKAENPFEIELSVDETEQPTTLAEHYIIAHQCLGAGMKLVSLAPRFIGDFEKGVDFKGDIEKLEVSIKRHAGIAEMLGPYKLSLHSGSDKISMYTPFARATKGRFHVKTAGTSYLEALRVVCRHDIEMFRRIVEFARDRYDTDKATYHVSATVDDCPEPDVLADSTALEYFYLENWADVETGKGFTQPGRQILHCTFGSTLTHEEFGPAILDCVKDHLDNSTEFLASHFTRHLDALRAGMPK